jgi:hypothetical protein
MCLSVITEKNKARLPKSAVGWKVFGKGVHGSMPGGLHGNQMRFRRGWLYRDPRPENMKIQSDMPRGGGFESYIPGFHAFAHKKDAIRMMSPGEVVVKVRLYSLVAIGTQGDEKVYVGRTMRLYLKKEE